MSRLRRRAVALAVSATMAAALASLGSAAISPAVASAAPRVTCADAAADGEVTVAFVIDFSGAPGAPDSGIVKACVGVPSGDNDSEALAALAGEGSFAIPRYNDSGLLCAIGGIPAKGCGQQVKGGYDYWSYWQGSPGGWTYANTGPAENQVNSSVVQGWRWENSGRGSPSDAQPRGPTTPGPICDPSPPATTTTTIAPTTLPPSRVPPVVSTTSPSISPVSEAPASTAASSGTRRATEPITTTSSAVSGRVAPSTAAPAAGQHGNTTSSTEPGRGPTTSPTSAATTGAGPGPAPGDQVKGERAGGQLASSPARSPSQGGGGTSWLLIGLVVLLVGALGGAAAYRWRRTPPS